jgi:uncharacterized membrane protein YadS
MKFVSNIRSIRQASRIIILLSHHVEACDLDVAFTLACVTLFSVAVVSACQLLSGLLHLDQHGFGPWSGASIHGIAQAMAASVQNGDKTGEFATLTRITRVMLLTPMVTALRARASRVIRSLEQQRR